jgi:hypothetical protein
LHFFNTSEGMADEVDIVADNELQEREEFNTKMLSTGLIIHEETENLCRLELKNSCSVFIKLTHRLMQHYVHIEQTLERHFDQLTAESRESLLRRMREAATSDSSCVDDILHVISETFRTDFKELMTPIQQLKEKCLQFEQQLREESANLRRRNRAISTPRRDQHQQGPPGEEDSRTPVDTSASLESTEELTRPTSSNKKKKTG